MKKNDERGEHHVALWLANDYSNYCRVMDVLKPTFASGVSKALGVQAVAKALLPVFKYQTADGFKYTLSRIAAYVATEWDEMDLQERNNG